MKNNRALEVELFHLEQKVVPVYSECHLKESFSGEQKPLGANKTLTTQRRTEIFMSLGS